jgi:hypothetical protein
MTPEKADEKRAGRFPKGQSGNPAGKPKGTRNATTLALEALLDGQASALTQKAIDVALTGDIPALRLCMDRILPPRKDSPVAFDLPEMKTLNDAVPGYGGPCQSGWGRRPDAGGGRRADKNGAGSSNLYVAGSL